MYEISVIKVTCLFYYSRFSDVTIITALLHHSAYVIVDGKVIKMERLNEPQLRAQAVRMFEENYSYSEIVKKLGRNKGWVRKWTRHWGRIWQDLCKVKVAGD